MNTHPLTDEELNVIEFRSTVLNIDGKDCGVSLLELGFHYREDVARLIIEIRRQNAVLSKIDVETRRIDAGLDRVLSNLDLMQTSELAIIERFYKRVCERAEATIERTHQVAGAHYAAMQVELSALRPISA